MVAKHIQLSLAMAFALACLSSAAFANEEGKALYDEYCMSCHGPDKEGVQNYTGDLENFTARLNGETENMSDFTDFFEDDEIVALHEYLMAPD